MRWRLAECWPHLDHVSRRCFYKVANGCNIFAGQAWHPRRISQPHFIQALMAAVMQGLMPLMAAVVQALMAAVVQAVMAATVINC